MQTPINQVSAALRMYYSGMSLDGIQGQLQQQFGNKVAESTIYYWIVRFTKQAIEKSKSFKPKIGDIWIADETGIDVHGNKRDLWFWDIIDSESRYLLASHISNTRTTEDAQALISKAIHNAGKYPRVIITDKLRSYIDAIDQNKIQHIQSKPFTTIDSTNKIERFHGTFKDRTKVVRAYKNLKSANLITQGWLIHYNFFKEHTSLDNVPPAVKMHVTMPFNDWNDVVKQSQLPVRTDPEQINFPLPIHLSPEQEQRQVLRLKMRKTLQKHIAKRKAQKSMASIRIGRK
jgi:transposase-like protein